MRIYKGKWWRRRELNPRPITGIRCVARRMRGPRVVRCIEGPATVVIASLLLVLLFAEIALDRVRRACAA